jgi:DNA-binding NarL/FixJ family response regulator
MPNSVMIVEHAEIVRKGMISILEESGLFFEIRELACSANMHELIKRYQPKLVIINPSMVSFNFREQVESNTYKPYLVAIMYGFHDEAVMGVFDEIIPVNDTRVKIIKKLSKLIQKEPAGHQSPQSQLSSRELDVLKLLVRGFSNKDISNQLFVSPHTVISHRKNIIQKLNIKSVAGLTVYAIINGIMSVEELT